MHDRFSDRYREAFVQVQVRIVDDIALLGRSDIGVCIRSHLHVGAVLALLT